MVHFLDGIKALNKDVLRFAWNHPRDGICLFLIIFAVAGRDFLLWLCMGNAYLNDDD